MVSFVKVKDHDEKSVMAAISKYGKFNVVIWICNSKIKFKIQIGPCVTSLDVEDGLMQYTKGVYDGKNSGVTECTSQVNHGIY